MLLRGTLRSSFCLRGKNRLLTCLLACLPPIVNPRFDTVSDTVPGMAFYSGAPSASRCVNPARHIQTTYRSTVLEQVARTSQDMTELQRHQPEAILFGSRLRCDLSFLICDNVELDSIRPLKPSFPFRPLSVAEMSHRRSRENGVGSVLLNEKSEPTCPPPSFSFRLPHARKPYGTLPQSLSWRGGTRR